MSTSHVIWDNVAQVAGRWILREQRRAFDEWRLTGCPPDCPCKRGKQP